MPNHNYARAQHFCLWRRPPTSCCHSVLCAATTPPPPHRQSLCEFFGQFTRKVLLHYSHQLNQFLLSLAECSVTITLGRRHHHHRTSPFICMQNTRLPLGIAVDAPSFSHNIISLFSFFDNAVRHSCNLSGNASSNCA